MAASAHLRGIVIAGVLAAVALALGFMTLAMNQTASQAAPKTILPLKARHHASAAPTKKVAAKPKAKPKPKPKPLDKNFVNALKGGLPRSVAQALAKHPVAVVALTSKTDSVAALAAGEAKAGAADAGASFVAVNVDGNGGDVEVLTRVLGQLPVAPATLIYTRPAKLVTTLPSFNDQTVVEQAAVSATPDVALAGNNTWATQANAICAAADAAQKAAHKSKAPTSETYAADSAVAHQTVDKLTALKPPAGEKASLQTANAEFQQGLALMDQAAAKAQTAKNAAAALYVNALTTIGKAFTTYNRLGATVCTSVT